ncbi:MAG: DUF1127 domain-containing protein [Alphaproteobacteria bacterium]|jgi:uncharacterized protein YjiS (DUF1127 family)|nr:DUF1127 domain-containing protein [Alphaproteobacteria bacterium]
MSRIEDIENAIATGHAPTRNDGLGLLAVASRLLDSLYLWQARIDERRELAGFDERLLKDAGMSRGDVLIESSKPFWRP